jgi:LysR family transcriptional activator of glutamate synthase operon
MQLENLQEFVTLADTGSFAAAADILFLSQATLSRHIRDMEQELGLPLFYRTSRRVRISRYGAELLPYARQMTALQQSCTDAIGSLLKKTNGALTIGTLPNAAAYGITELLANFKQEYPNIEITLVQDKPDALRTQLLAGACDFIFVRDIPQGGCGELACMPYAVDELVAVLAASHPLAGAPSVRLEQLRGEDFALLPRHSSAYHLAVEACRRAGFEPHQTFNGTTGSGIFDLVGHGLCVALMTRRPAQTMLTPHTVLVPVEPKVASCIDLLYPRDPDRQTARNFLRFCRGWVRRQGLPACPEKK